MQTSRTGSRDKGGIALLLVLLLSNAVFFAAWPWLRGESVGAVSTDAPLNTVPGADRILRPAAFMRNVDYASWLFDAVRKARGVLFLGTSESIHPDNLGAQLNALRPDAPPMVVLAQAGMSPIPSALSFASWDAEGLEVPPLILIVNLVYFTHSHDVINEGWMSKVTRSPTFLYMNDGNLRQGLTENVREIYDRHFSSRKFLYPIHLQEYLGNLMYLRLHRGTADMLQSQPLPIPRFRFEGPVPEYDEAQAVHAGNVTSDEIAKWRWTVSTADDSVNLQGLISILSSLRGQAAPVLITVLPVNRTFYAYNGVDLADYDRRYQTVRDAMAGLKEPGRVFLLDLYEGLDLHLGFTDRMHLDGYGYSQVVEQLDNFPSYGEFLDAVRKYYATPRTVKQSTDYGRP